jgi:pyridoxal phosphate enzyme (YggS family)
VAVTKYATLAQVAELVGAGVLDLGENHYQQLRDRAQEPALVAAGVRWHAIGPLQANKVKYVARFASTFHALTDAATAETLSARRVAEGLDPIDCYVEVNVAGEATKAGVEPAEVGPLVAACAGLAGVRVIGLMTMPPLAADPEDSRRWFAALRELAVEHGLPGLSMGTSADYEVAVEEGATTVRIGAALT